MSWPTASVPGSSALAELGALSTPPGVDAALFDALKNTLRGELLRYGTYKAASAPPTGLANQVNDLTATYNEANETYVLSWHYRNLGDYNQNGTVEIGDVTPIAMHFLNSALVPNSIEAVIDGSGNGKVDISDVTQLAMNFGVRFQTYLIEQAETPESEWTELGPVTLADASGVGRKQFQVEVTPAENMGFVRVVPLEGEQRGIEGLPAALPEPPPKIHIISISPQSGVTGTEVTFTAVIEADLAVTYAWSFGGGATPNESTEESPTVTLGAPGNYDASLTIENADGSDTMEFTLVVNPETGEPPNITSVSPTQAPPNATRTFTATVTGDPPFTYSWNFGSGASPSTSTEAAPEVTTSGTEGTYPCSLTVENDWGEDTYDFNLQIILTGNPAQIVEIGMFMGQTGTEKTFSVTVSGDPPISYSWNFGGGATPNTSTQASPKVTLGAVGSYPGHIHVENAFGGDDRDFTLVVYE